MESDLHYIFEINNAENNFLSQYYNTTNHSQLDLIKSDCRFG